jgi:hypothetical protein
MIFQINLFLLFAIFGSYFLLFYFTKNRSKLWFGMDQTIIPIKVWLVPIVLASIGYIYLLGFIHSGHHYTTETSNALFCMYLFAFVWAPALYISMNYSKTAKFVVVLCLLGVSLSAIVLLFYLVRYEARFDLIIAIVFILFQSFIDSFIWSYYFLSNL